MAFIKAFVLLVQQELHTKDAVIEEMMRGISEKFGAGAADVEALRKDAHERAKKRRHDKFAADQEQDAEMQEQKKRQTQKGQLQTLEEYRLRSLQQIRELKEARLRNLQKLEELRFKAQLAQCGSHTRAVFEDEYQSSLGKKGDWLGISHSCKVSLVNRVNILI